MRVVQPGAVHAAVLAEEQAGSRRDAAREAMVRELEAARYAADRAFRQYDAADPENRLVAGELESRWNRSLAHVAEVEKRIAQHDANAPAPPDVQSLSLASLADDLAAVWAAPTTDARLKKRIVRAVIEEAGADLDDQTSEIVLVLHWAGGAHTEHRLPRRQNSPGSPQITARNGKWVRLGAAIKKTNGREVTICPFLPTPAPGEIYIWYESVAFVLGSSLVMTGSRGGVAARRDERCRLGLEESGLVRAC